MKRVWRHAAWLVPLLLLAALWSTSTPLARAQEHPVRAGHQEVNVEIDDRRGLAITTVTQDVVNRAGSDQPATLDFPLRDDAALLRFDILAPAPKKNEEPGGRGHIAAAGRNQYRVTLNRVPARGRAQFQLRYAETIARRGSRRKYVYPVPPRSEMAPAGMSLRVQINAAGAPENASSTSYPLTVHRTGPRSVVLSYDTQHALDGKDVVIDYQVAPDPGDTAAKLAILAPGDGREDPYFFLTLPAPATLFHGNRAGEKPVDVIFCLDVSGSTAGRKANAIREALHDGLTDLTPRDRFSTVAFDDDARAFRRELLPATPAATSAAMRFIGRIRPSGPSDPGRGLEAAVEILSRRGGSKDRPAILAVLVDDEDPAGIAAEAARLNLEKRKIHLVVLGAMRDSRLVHYRLRGNKLKRGPAIALSRAALTYGASLAGATLDLGPLNTSYVYPMPDHLPELPLSTPVTFFGRLNQAPPAHGLVTLNGKMDGARRALPVQFSLQNLDAASPVPSLWANRRVRRLNQIAQRSSGESAEAEQAISALRAEHGMPTTPTP